jgi:hypothetical protein
LRFSDDEISNRASDRSGHRSIPSVPDAVGNPGLSALAATANAFNIKTGAVYFSHPSES